MAKVSISPQMGVSFLHKNYKGLLDALGHDAAASIPVEMELNGKIHTVRLVVASKFAPKDPVIAFDYENEFGYWFKVTSKESDIFNHVFIEHHKEISPQVVEREAEVALVESSSKVSVHSRDVVAESLKEIHDILNRVSAWKKGVGFSNKDYSTLLETLGPDAWASTPVKMELNGKIHTVQLQVASRFAPKNPVITFVYENEDGHCFKVSDRKGDNSALIFVEKYKEISSPILGFGDDSLKISCSVLAKLNYQDKVYSYTFNKQKVTFKYNDFLLTTQESGDESSHPGNHSLLKDNSKTYFQEGRVHFCSSKQIASTGGRFLYVVDKNGTLYTHSQSSEQGAIHHSYFLKGKIGGNLYGYGRAIASGGYLQINQEGKIIEIDNGSGHYCPSLKQLLIVSKYLKGQGVLSDECLITSHIDQATYRVDDLDQVNVSELLGDYQTIEEL